MKRKSKRKADWRAPKLSIREQQPMEVVVNVETREAMLKLTMLREEVAKLNAGLDEAARKVRMLGMGR